MRVQKSIFQYLDWTLVGLYLALVFIGFFTIYAAIYTPNVSTLFNFEERQGKQLIWIAAGFVIAIGILIIDKNFFEYFSYPIYIGTILLLVGVLLFGHEVAGSKSWFEIGSVRLQPAEFAKFATVLCLAKYLSATYTYFNEFKTKVIAIIIMLIPAVMVILQNDTGSALVYAALVIVLYREGLSGAFFLVGLVAIFLFIMALVLSKTTIIISLLLLSILLIYNYRKKFTEIVLIIIAFFIASSFVFSVNYVFENVLKEHQKTRITVLLGEEDKLDDQLTALKIKLEATPETDPNYKTVKNDVKEKRKSLKTLRAGAGWNVRQSKIAIGSGGIIGKGYLQGTQTKFNFVPEQSTDFIFCTVGEEWGFFGSVILFILYISLFARIVHIAERQKSQFARIYGYGVASILFFHFTINIAMTIGLAPTIGIPLPFLSYGGSSLWAFTILLFIFIKLDSDRAMIL